LDDDDDEDDDQFKGKQNNKCMKCK